MTAITTTTSPRLPARLVAMAAAVALLASTAPQWAPELAQVLPGLSSSPATPAPDRLTAPRIAPAFEANLGQFNPDVAFVARAPGHDLFLTPTEAVVSLAGAPGTEGEPAVVRIRSVGGRAVPAGELVGDRRQPGTVNYLIGNDPAKWQRNVPRYGAVTYPSVYPGIDLVYHSGAKGLEYDYVVAPGADPSLITVEVEGATGLRVEDGGDLVADTPAGAFRQAKPVVYQHQGPNRQPVAGAWVLDAPGQARFRLGPYDHTKKLVIDPVLVYSSFLGGSGADYGAGYDAVTSVAVDDEGSAYLTGLAGSPDFPTTTEGFQYHRPHNGVNAFVAKVTADGADLEWATYLGGTMELRTDLGKALAVDASGAPSVVLHTTSPDFPVTDDTTCSCAMAGKPIPAVAVARLTADGAGLAWATFLGPAGPGVNSNSDKAWYSWPAGIALDTAGETYVVSRAGPGFPTTDGSTCASPSPCTAPGIVASFAADGARQYVTYRDGAGAGIAVERDGEHRGRAYLAGTRDGDASVAAVDADGAALWERSLGGGGQDSAAAVALAPGGRLFVTGTTASADFPATEGALSTGCAGATASGCASDAWVAELRASPPAGGVVWATYLGGTGADEAAGLAVEPSGALWLAGTTNSVDLPLLNAVQDSRPGSGAAFLARLAPGGGSLLESTYLGGGRMAAGALLQVPEPVFSRAAGVAVDTGGAAYVVGHTNSADYPVHGGFQAYNAQGYLDGFVTKLAPAGQSGPAVVALSPSMVPTSGGTWVTIRGTALAGARAVDFGATRVPCPSPGRCQEFTAADGTTAMRVLAPPGPRGPASVRVTTAAGTSAPGSWPSFSYTPGSWEAAPGAAARTRPVAVLLANGQVLVAGGCCDANGDGLASAQLFDPRTGAWTPAAPMNFGRKRGKVSPVSDETYGPAAVLLTGPRCGLDCGKVLVAGGATGTVAETVTSELYTPDPDGPGPKTDGWERLVAAYDENFGMATMLDDGMVLFLGGGGQHALGPGGVVRDRQYYRVRLYDPATRTWADEAASGYWHGWGTATRLRSGKVLVAGGVSEDESAASGTWEACDIGGNNWCEAPPVLFDPSAGGPAASGSWHTSGPGPRTVQASAALLEGPAEACGANCGKVLVTGGTPESTNVGLPLVVGHADLYDPAKPADDQAAWRGTEAMVGPTRWHTSTLLPDGTVLVAGGEARHGRATSSLFDPRDTPERPLGHWVEAGEPLARRSAAYRSDTRMADHVAVVLSSNPTRFEADPAVCGANCGKVLVVGGNDTDAAGQPIGPTAELYTPSPTVRSVTPAAPPGATVTIKGVGFTNVAAGQRPKVSFAGVEAADVAVVSYDTITATAPAAVDKATVDVIVTNHGGRSETGPASTFAYTGLPGLVRNVAAAAMSESEITVSFDAAGMVGDLAPPATDYQVRFSRSPIADAASFDAAKALSHPPFAPSSVGQRLSLDVGGLRPGTTYYFAVRALGPGGGAGPVSQASTTTLGIAPVDDVGDGADQVRACTGLPPPGPSQVAYPRNRYSLIGGPEGTVVGAGSPLYSWFDLGARGEYAVAPGDAGLQAGRGYWAWFACPKLVDFGAGQDSVSFGLGAYRASMVANPSGTSPATATGHDFAARWAPDANGGSGAYEISGYRTPQRLAVGEGAWMFSYIATEIRIQATG